MKAALLAVLIAFGVIAAGSNGTVASPLDTTLTSAPMTPVWDEDTDEEEWKCTCSVTCDGERTSRSQRVCADDEQMAEAIDEAVEACESAVDAQCGDASCSCKCKPTGREC